MTKMKTLCITSQLYRNRKNSYEKSEGILKESLHNFMDSDNSTNNWRSTGKNLEVTPLVVDFSKAFDSTYKGKTEQIQLA